jgi:hypothetical protein
VSLLAPGGIKGSFAANPCQIGGAGVAAFARALYPGILRHRGLGGAAPTLVPELFLVRVEVSPRRWGPPFPAGLIGPRKRLLAKRQLLIGAAETVGAGR